MAAAAEVGLTVGLLGKTHQLVKAEAGLVETIDLEQAVDPLGF
jgi:hypothetical protein